MWIKIQVVLCCILATALAANELRSKKKDDERNKRTLDYSISHHHNTGTNFRSDRRISSGFPILQAPQYPLFYPVQKPFTAFKKGRPNVGTPPYAVQMEPLVHYSQRDPLYEAKALHGGTTNDIKPKEDLIREHSHNSRISYAYPPIKHVIERPVYIKEPEPIIEIIIKESNITLPPLPTPPVTVAPRKKEQVQVFYVKYKKNPNGYGKDSIIYDKPVPAIAPHVPEEPHHVEIPQQKYEPIFTATVPPPPSTTLRAIVKPESESYHADKGIHITFGKTVNEQRKRSHTDDAKQESAPQPAVAHLHNPALPAQPLQPQGRQYNPFPTQTFFSNRESQSPNVNFENTHFSHQFKNDNQKLQHHYRNGQAPASFSQPQHFFNSNSSPNNAQGTKPPNYSHQAFLPRTTPPQQFAPTQFNNPQRQPVPYQQFDHQRHQQSQVQFPRPHTHFPINQQISHNSFQQQSNTPQSQAPKPITNVPTFQPLPQQRPLQQQPPQQHFAQTFNQQQFNHQQQIHHSQHQIQPQNSQTSSSEVIKSLPRYEGHISVPTQSHSQNFVQSQKQNFAQQEQQSFAQTQHFAQPQQQNFVQPQKPQNLAQTQHFAQPQQQNFVQSEKQHSQNFGQPQKQNFAQQGQQSFAQQGQQSFAQQGQQNFAQTQHFTQSHQQSFVQPQPQQTSQHLQQLHQLQQLQQQHLKHLQQLQQQPQLPQNFNRQQQDFSQQQFQQTFQPTVKSVSTTYRPSSTTTTTPSPSTTEGRLTEDDLKALNIELPDEVPDDLREQLLSSGILKNAQISILDYDKIGDTSIADLPPDQLANFFSAGGGQQIAAGSENKETVVQPDGKLVSSESAIDSSDMDESESAPSEVRVQAPVEMKVVHFDPQSEEGQKVPNSYIQEGATQIDPVALDDQQYNRYLPVKVNGAAFPIPDVPELKGRSISSVVVLAPVDLNFQESQRKARDVSNNPKTGRQLAAEALKTLISNPTTENFKDWLNKENNTVVDKQAVILLVTGDSQKSSNEKEIFMYDLATQSVSKLSGELSSAFVDAAETNAQQNLAPLQSAASDIVETRIPYPQDQFEEKETSADLEEGASEYVDIKLPIIDPGQSDNLSEASEQLESFVDISGMPVQEDLLTAASNSVSINSRNSKTGSSKLFSN